MSISSLTERRKLRLEHVHGDDVDDHDPDGTVESLGLIPDKSQSRDALVFQLLPKKGTFKMLFFLFFLLKN